MDTGRRPDADARSADAYLSRADFAAAVAGVDGADRAARALFAGADAVKGDAFVKRGARLPARVSDAIVARASPAPPPAAAATAPAWLRAFRGR